MPAIRVAAALAGGLSVLLAACGSGESGTTGTHPARPVDSAAALDGAPQIKTVALTCTDGMAAAKVSNAGGSPTDVAVTWTPQKNRGAEYVSYVVTLDSADGNTSRQVAKTIYVSGHSPDQFVFDFGTSHQTNLTATNAGLSGLSSLTPWTASRECGAQRAPSTLTAPTCPPAHSSCTGPDGTVRDRAETVRARRRRWLGAMLRGVARHSGGSCVGRHDRAKSE